MFKGKISSCRSEILLRRNQKGKLPLQQVFPEKVSLTRGFLHILGNFFRQCSNLVSMLRLFRRNLLQGIAIREPLKKSWKLEKNGRFQLSRRCHFQKRKKMRMFNFMGSLFCTIQFQRLYQWRSSRNLSGYKLFSNSIIPSCFVCFFDFRIISIWLFNQSCFSSGKNGE